MVLSRHRERQDRGAVLVIVALFLVVMCAMAAFAVDLGYARQQSRHVQSVSDAAALAGALELPLATPDAIAAAAARDEAAENAILNLTGSSDSPTATPCAASVPANSTCYAVDDIDMVVATPYTAAAADAPAAHNLIYVEICRPTPRFFSGVIGRSGPTVCRQAVARRVNASGGFGLGLITLNETQCASLQFRGDSSTILSSAGAVLVNSECASSATGALDSSGASWHLEADFIGVVGNATLAPCDPLVTSTCTATEPTEGIPHFDDPLNLSVPDPLPTMTRPCSFTGAGPIVLDPGRYLSRCTFEGNRQYIFRPGVYYFDQGFRSAGAAPLVCSSTATTFEGFTADDCAEGVTFIIGGNSFELTGSSQVFLPPPPSGPYQGVSIFHAGADASIINGTNDFALGTIYAPNATLTFTGAGGDTPTGDAVNVTGMVVADNIDIAGSFRFNILIPPDAPQTTPEDDLGLYD